MYIDEEGNTGKVSRWSGRVRRGDDTTGNHRGEGKVGSGRLETLGGSPKRQSAARAASQVQSAWQHLERPSR